MTGIHARRDATGTPSVVTRPHPLASEDGRRGLAAGGNAIDATIAIGAVFAVTYPHVCGLGGDAVWLVAARFVKRMMARCRKIGDAPDGGRPRDDLEPGLRIVPFEQSAYPSGPYSRSR